MKLVSVYNFTLCLHVCVSVQLSPTMLEIVTEPSLRWEPSLLVSTIFRVLLSSQWNKKYPLGRNVAFRLDAFWTVCCWKLAVAALYSHGSKGVYVNSMLPNNSSSCWRAKDKVSKIEYYMWSIQSNGIQSVLSRHIWEESIQLLDAVLLLNKNKDIATELWGNIHKYWCKKTYLCHKDVLLNL